MKHLLVIIALLGALPASAEIEKTGTPCKSGICLFWWPKLPSLDGWHQDLGSSQHYGANTLAPEGSTFKDAETIMYARAMYKPRVPEAKSLQAFIENDKKDFAQNVPGVVISESAVITTADGQKMRSLTYFPASEGNWERTAYGEEDDFYLIFTISARTKAGYDKAQPAFEKLIHAYKKKL